MVGSALEAEKPLEAVQIPVDGFDFKKHLWELEKNYYKKAIETCDGNRTKAAKLLQIKPPAFRRRAREDFNL